MGDVGHPRVQWDGTPPTPPLALGGTGLEQPPWHLSPPGFSRTVPVSATWPGGSGTKPGGWRRGLRCAGTLPLPTAASCRGPLSSPARKGPDSVPQRSGEPEPSRGSCSVLSVGARCLFLYQQQEYLLSRMENDPSCSVHDPSPSLVLLGLVYPRFCCRVRLFGCRCPICMSPPCWGGDWCSLGRGQLQQHLPERRVHCRDTWLGALVAAGGFISVHPKSGLGGSGGRCVAAGSGDACPACALSPFLLLGMAAPSSQRVLPAHFLTLRLHFLPAGCTLQLPFPTGSLKPHGDTSGSSSPQE